MRVQVGLRELLRRKAFLFALKQQCLSFEAIRARMMKTIEGGEHLDFLDET